MNYFATTRLPNNVYEIFVNACKKDAEKELNKSLKILYLDKKKLSLKFIFYLLKIIITGKIFFKDQFIYLKYRNCSIGRHSMSTALRDMKSYLSPFHLFYKNVKYLILSGLIIDSLYFNLKKIDAAYVDHGIYLNGVIIQLLANNNKIVYQNVYPRGISRKTFAKKDKNLFFEYEDLLIFKKNEKNLSIKNKKEAKNKIRIVTNNPENIPWIKGVKFKKVKNENLKKLTHIVYAHSFADGQLGYGLDGFSNVREWIEFTLEKLDNEKNLVYVKAHPNYTTRRYVNEACAMDQHIFSLIKKKFKFSKRLIFEDKAIKNVDLLKLVNKKTILISHHGSVIFENIYKNFKNISSSATFWEDKLKITNQWSTKEEYEKILKKNWSQLKFANQEDFLKICYLLYCNEYGHYGKKFWLKIISDKMKIPYRKLDTNLSGNIEKLKDKQKNILINLISHNIQILN